MKKVLAVLLAVCLLIGLTAVAEMSIAADEISTLLGVSSERLTQIYPTLKVSAKGNAMYSSDLSLVFVLEGDTVACVTSQYAGYSILGITPGMTVSAAESAAAELGYAFTMDNGLTRVADLGSGTALLIDYSGGSVSMASIACGSTAMAMVKSLGIGDSVDAVPADIVSTQTPAPDEPAPQLPTITVSANGATDLTDYLGAYLSDLRALVPGIETGNDGTTAYTSDFGIWTRIRDDRIVSVALADPAYSLYGISLGMSAADAGCALTDRGIVYEDHGSELWANSTATGLSYISAKVENGVITDLMCGDVDLNAVSAPVFSDAVAPTEAPAAVPAAPAASTGTDLTAYLGKHYSELAAVVPSITTSNTGTAFTPNFEVWVKIESDRLTCISIESADYSLYGLTPGMTAEQARAVLDGRGIAYTDSGSELYADSTATGLSYISANLDNGIVIEIMCGAVDLDAVSEITSAAAPTAGNAPADSRCAYSATAACAAAFDAKGWSYDLDGMLDNNEERIITDFNGDNFENFTVTLDFSSDSRVFMHVYDLIYYLPENQDEVARVCNDLNNEYVYVRFIADPNDSTVFVQVDSVLAEDTAGDTCVFLLQNMLSIADEAYDSLIPFAR